MSIMPPVGVATGALIGHEHGWLTLAFERGDAMCGICGGVGRMDGLDRAAMLRALAHRGPDDEGSWVSEGTSGTRVWLGHRRLSILDLTPTGHQPMATADGRYTIALNGEIYNFRAIRAELAAKGHRFRGTGDTEVLLAAWAEWADGCVERLRGMFAFALWDASEATMWLARDRMGEKPLYYISQRDHLIFASELRCLFASGLVDRVLDSDGLDSYLAFGSVAQPLTLVRDVRSLEPGQVARYHAGQFRVRTYWQLSDIVTRSDRDVGQTIEDVRAALDDAIGLCQVSDVPVGLLLSGGVDSTAILARMSHRGDPLPETFSVGFSGADRHLSEFEWSDRVAAHFRTVHHRIELDARDAQRIVGDSLAVMDQPSKDGVNHFIVMRAVARAGYKVAITGQGADELFYGYGRHRFFRFGKAVAAFRSPPPLQALLEKAVRGVMPGKERLSKLAMLLGPGDPEQLAYLARHMVFSHQEIQELHGERREPPARWVGSAGGGTPLERLYRLEATRLLRNQLLRDGDQMSMAVSLELRAPFVDQKLVELAFSIPSALMVRPGEAKPLLVSAADDALVRAVSQRPKVGFAIPLQRWVNEAIENPPIDPIRLGFRPRAVAEHVRAGRAGWRFGRYWTLLVLHEWMRLNQVRAA